MCSTEWTVKNQRSRTEKKMQYFQENLTLDDGLLQRIGMGDKSHRSHMTEYVENMFRFVCPEFRSMYLDFLNCLNKRVDEIESCKTAMAQLSVVNGQLTEALSAYKEKRNKYRKEISERDSEIAIMRIDLNEYDSRLAKCLAEGCTVDASNKMQLAELDSANSKLRQASDAVEKELRDVVDTMRMKIQGAMLERDDALADCGMYIDRMLQAEEDLRKSHGFYATILGELSVAKMELSRRRSSERGIFRAQVFQGSNGTELICPVPTMDGVLISLIDVYRGWLAVGLDTGEWADGGFISPVTGVCFIDVTLF